MAFSKASFVIPFFVRESYSQIVETGFSESALSTLISRSPSVNMSSFKGFVRLFKKKGFMNSKSIVIFFTQIINLESNSAERKGRFPRGIST